ncbi:serine hydrolase domain-containing protein [Spirosoma oryzicola]|uniref:serine hydrolase domain-containing protein n=1 Tax=Spirosoma oryzicola TaxID=2898794 RepID=UPI001E64962B|nr:serine hydrolase [Spirosoma oryzicola]UHG93002.1 beta-lactamase family protein [Spirosoma oryzicola]
MVIRPFLLLSIILVTSRELHAQSDDLVKSQGITSAVHKAAIGRIVFTSKQTPPEELKASDFLDTYELTNKSNLFMTVFMGNSLTNYLHPLAPTLQADSLAKVGNYQFLFYVDNRLIYQSNLHPGAPYARIKDWETVISKPLIDNQHEGAWWSQSAWNRFMRNGGDSALTEGHHVFKLEIKPYVKLIDVKVGEPIAVGELALDVKRKPVLNLADIQLAVPKPYSGLPVSSEPFDTRKIKELKGNIEADVFRHITSVVVIKNGNLLVEEYFNGTNRNTLHDVRSVGKSFASSLAGIAQYEGYLKSENQALADFYQLKTFPNYSTAKAQTTLKELLTMSSAFEGDDNEIDSPGNEEKMYPTANWVKFVLDLPVNPGKFKGEWHYFTAGVVLLGDVLNKLVPDNLDSYAKQKLFSPLGISNYKWQYTPQHVVSTAGGIQMNALDFAKYGQLYKNGGKWKDKQVLPAEWVAKTFTKYKAIPGRNDEHYGYLFWNKKYHVGGNEYETYYCAGNGGNKIFIMQNQPLVIVVTATAYNTPYAHPQVDRMMEEYILPAVLK